MTSHSRRGSTQLITAIVIVLIAVVGVLVFVQPAPQSALSRNAAAPDEPSASTEPQQNSEPATQDTEPSSQIEPEPVTLNPMSGPPQLDGSTPPNGQPQAARPTELPLVVSPERFNYGYVLVGETRQEQVVVDNPSNISITVTNLLSACPCTKAEINPQTIGPGQSAVLTLNYTAQSFPHVAPLRSVRIQTREFPNAVAQVIFEAAVGREIRVNSDREPAISQQSGELRLESYDGEPFNVLLVDGRPPEFVDFDPETDQPRPAYLVRYDLSTRPDGSVPRHIHILTDRASDPMTEIPTRFSPNFREPLNAQPPSWLAENRLVQVGTLSPSNTTVRRTVLLQRMPNTDESDLEAFVRPAIGRSIIGGETQRTSDSPAAVAVRVISIEQDPDKARNRAVTLEFTLLPDTPAGLHHDILTFILPDGSYSELDTATFVAESN